MEPCRQPSIPQVILVEDNPGDVEFVRLALEGLAVDLEILSDGQSAIDFIQGEPLKRDALFLVDLNLPRRHGFEVLEAIRQLSNETCHIEAMVWSSSVQPADQERVQELGARACLRKPDCVDDINYLCVMLRTMLMTYPQA